MKNQLLTKHCALTLLMALIAATWSNDAWALTINVNVTGSQAPYVYAWDNAQNPLTDAYPGTQLTNVKRVGGKTWYYIDLDATSVNVILSFGDDDSKTVDITDIAGNRYFEFANNNANNVTDYYDLPADVEFETTPFCYAVNTNGWGSMYAYVYDSSSNPNHSWPGEEMTKVGTNGNGNDVYKWTGTTPANPATVIFNNDNGSQTSNLTWANGAYWSVYGQDSRMTITGAVLNATNFPDENFRDAVSTITGKSEGEAITTNNQKVLHIEEKGISNLAGIEFFTNLEELYAGGNDISSNVILTSNPNLRILDLNGNAQLQGTSSQHTPYVDVTKCKNLEDINFANTGCTWMGGLQHIDGGGTYSNLKKLNLHNVGLDYMTTETMQKMPNLEWIDLSGNQLTNNQGFSNNTKLKYIDVSGNPQNAKNFVLVALTQLKTFKAANCHLNENQTTYNSSSNYFPTESVEYVDLSGNTALTTLYCPATNNLKTLIVNGCTGLQGSSSAGALGGSSTYIPRMTHLEHLELNNVDLYLHTGEANGLFTLLSPSVAPNLHYIDLSNDKLGNAAKPKFAFPALDTLLINGNPALTELTVTSLNAPEKFTLDVTNDAALTAVAITNSGMTQATMPTITSTGATSLYKLDLTNNAFTDVPTTGIASLTTLVMNDNLLSDINVSESNIQYLYAQNNNFPTGDYTLPTTSLVGLDLGNNDFTKFKAENNTSLKSLALAGNDNLTEIELHGNTALTQTSPDGIIESDNGLYIKGLSNLKVLNIENSSFNKLGQQHSLQGVTALETLKARHNEFTTFTNGVYELHTSATNPVNYRKPDPTQSSLEYQTNLKYLDLAYNKLRDSVHLYRNTALVHLDVSYNRSIDGQLDPAAEPLPKTAAQKAAILEQKGRRWMKYGKVGGKTYGVNATPGQWEAHYTNLQAGRLRPFDLRKSEPVCDLNDTTGLYHLDLGKNVNLERLDIRYTNIHNTAAGPSYMCPGWMTEDWVGDDDLSATKASGKNTTGRWYSSWHTFVYFIPCSKLKVIHADHNNMRSLGIRYFPDLDTLTCSYMYGDSEVMRDFPTKWASGDLRYNMGNTALSTTIKKFHKVDWENLDDDGNPAIVLWGPNRTEASSDVYPNKLRYWDLSYSGFNEIRLYPGTVTPDLPYLEYVNVSGNPLNFQVRHYNSAGALVDNSTVSNYNSLDLTYCPNIRTVLAENCADLPIVRAHNRTKLDTLYLSNDPNLKTLYVQNDPLLKTNFQGLNTLTGLETLFAYNNTHWGNDITFASNTALKNLWISNINASQLDVSANTALEKLRAYDNSLTALNLSGNANLQWLDVARNKLPDIDLSHNTALQFVNFSNGTDTRTQLDGTEQLNHDGSDGDAIKPTTVYSADEAPIANANNGNSLSDLALPASITDARANGNDLHSITGSFANLTNIEFAHNHINGIDLSAASGATVESRDNGRTITADCAKFTPHGDFGNVVTVYFFQLADLSQQEVQNGTQLTLKTSDDIKGATRILGTDGLVLDNINWNQSNAGMLRNVTLNPSNMGDYLDPDEVPGSIVVLEAASETDNGAEGTATYTYDNGTSTPSVFYLNWSSDGTITGINSVIGDSGFDLAGTYGGIVVAGKDGTVVGVYDLNGRQVASETITGGKALITGLTPGIYLVNGQKVLVK